MIQLIADSGSTTTDWAVIADNRTIQIIKTTGINPIHQDDPTIIGIISSELCPALESNPEQIHFYGAGCIGGIANNKLSDLLSRLFPHTGITVASDLLGAARSLCGTQQGIAGILGTGANSCLYDGKAITCNIPPLGYILGDEGSGASLGKAFLRQLLRGKIDSQLTETFYNEYRTDYPQLIRHIYREPAANRFLASLSPFIAQHISHPDIQAIASATFKGFFENHIMQYDCHNCSVHLTGSVAYYYAPLIRQTATELGINIGHITRCPIEGLIDYHASQQQ